MPGEKVPSSLMGGAVGLWDWLLKMTLDVSIEWESELEPIQQGSLPEGFSKYRENKNVVKNN